MKKIAELSRLSSFWFVPASRSPLIWIIFVIWLMGNIEWAILTEVRSPSFRDRMVELLIFLILVVQLLFFMRFHNRVRKSLARLRNGEALPGDSPLWSELALLVLNPVCSLLITMTLWASLVPK